MKATVNNATAFEVSSNFNSKTVLLNDQSLPLDLLQNGAHLHFVWKGKSVNVEVISLSKEEKKVVLKVNNKTTEVRLEEPLDALLNSLGFSSANNAKIKQVKSPMPGLVLSISAEIGKEIKKDEPLLILEAMKMENVIKSPTDGVVKSISVNAGQAVEKGSVMITFE